MPLLVALLVIGALVFVLWIAIGIERGPGPADVAIAYETAWDRLDFDLLYELSGEELRDGMNRARFVAVKRAAHHPHPGSVGARVRVDDVVSTGQTAVVITSVTTDEGTVHNRLLLEKRSPGWTVVSYALRA